MKPGWQRLRQKLQLHLPLFWPNAWFAISVHWFLVCKPRTLTDVHLPSRAAVPVAPPAAHSPPQVLLQPRIPQFWPRVSNYGKCVRLRDFDSCSSKAGRMT